ncbi:hypothetical protein Tco_1277226 [Tanacetum coccineum]
MRPLPSVVGLLPSLKVSNQEVQGSNHARGLYLLCHVSRHATWQPDPLTRPLTGGQPPLTGGSGGDFGDGAETVIMPCGTTQVVTCGTTNDWVRGRRLGYEVAGLGTRWQVRMASRKARWLARDTQTNKEASRMTSGGCWLVDPAVKGWHTRNTTPSQSLAIMRWLVAPKKTKIPLVLGL